MNILNKCLYEINYNIPPQILAVAFKDNHQNYRHAPISLDELILTKVIRPKVLVDTNLVGGQLINIDLMTARINRTDLTTIVYEIPSDLVMNRTIISALSVGYLPYMNQLASAGALGGFNMGGMGNDLMNVVSRVSSSQGSIPNVSNASIELIGYNTISIRDLNGIASAYQARIMVGNEENLDNISPRSFNIIARLCVIAVKAYIYNNLIIAIDQAYLTGGQDLGSFKNIVESYSDEANNYNSYLEETVRAVLFMNDTEAHSRFIRMQICPGI